MTADPPNFPTPIYAGYCVVYGEPNHTSCGLGIVVLKN